MKILKLSIRNLASLKGDYEIDFEAIENEGGGIYAICGPTGSGKSTILDGICLALYGQTPRLQANIGGEFEAPVMSRGCAECRAVVEFSLRGCRYRSSWRQYRSRGRADGKLQAPQMELSRLDAPAVILTVKKQEHRDEIIRLTGLDFSRFTKVVMLAQGQFQNFLKLDSSGRGELLEKITGTEIYSEISRQVFMITAEHQKKRNDLEQELARLRGETGENATAENVERKSRDIAEEAAGLKKTQNQLREALRWHQERENLLLEEQQLQQREIEVAPLLVQLQQARKADDVYRDSFIQLQQARNRQGTLEQSIRLKTGEQISCNENAGRAAQLCGELQDRFGLVEQEWRILKEKLPGVRALDSRIFSEKKTISQQRLNFDKKEKVLAALKQELQDGAREEQLLVQRKAQVTQWQEKHPDIDQLEVRMQKFSGMRDRIQELAEQKGKLQQDAEKFEKETVSGKLAVQRIQEQTEKLQKKYEALKKEQQELAARKKEFLPEGDGENLSDLRSLLENEKQHVQTALDITRRLQEKQKFAEETEHRIDGQRKVLTEAQAACVILEKSLLADRKRLEHLKSLIHFVNQVADAEKMRSQLRPGSPCPVCGSLEHPYAVGILPELSDEVAESGKLENSLAEGSCRLGEWKGRQASAEEFLVQYKPLLDDAKKQIGQIEKELSAAVLRLHCSREDFEKTGPEKLNVLDHRLEDLRDFIRRQENLMEEFRCQEQALQQEENRLTEAQAQLLVVSAKEKQTRELLDKAECDIRKILAGYSREAAEFVEVKNLDGLTDLNEIQSRLAELCGEWRKQRTITEELQARSIALESRLAVLRRQIPEQEKEIRLDEQQIGNQEKILQGLDSERQKVFGELQPDQEEQRLNGKLENMRAELHRSITDRENLAGREREISASLQNLKVQLENVQKEVLDASASFDIALQENDFQDEEDWQKKRRNSEQLEFLTGRCDELMLLRTRYCTNQERCRKDGLKIPENLKEMNQENLQEQSDQAAELYQLKQQQLGRLQEQLELILRKGQEILKKEKILAEEQMVYDRWQELNAMIGSGGGDKFRRIVQGVTLDLVLEQANRQLAGLMDRYELRRSSVEDDRKCLELRIIDHWQNDSERDIRNISGGETFIVSLALALGLSAMKQGNLQVQSLFLDEGFGSLDEKNLENTIQMLANLNQGGRQIGLISHVEALKESVGTRIEVIPRKNTGFSILKGIGCRTL